MNLAALRGVALERLGMPGVVGIGLLLFALSFHFGTNSPAREELARLQAEESRLAVEARSGAAAVTTARAAALPSIAQAPELLKKLNETAVRHGVAIERSSYRVKGREGPGRLEIDLPLRVSYPALRAFLRDALRLAPGAALEELDLRRTQATDPAVDAQVRLSFGIAAS